MSAYVTDRFVPVRESRVQVDRTGDGVRIAVPPQRSLWQLGFAAWALFVITAGVVMMATGDEKPPLGFVAVWLGLGLSILSVAAWGALARETLLVDARALRHERRLGPIGRSRAYDRARVEHLRVSPESMSPFDVKAGLRIYGIGGGTIAFDYGARTVRVGRTEEAEARRIVEALANEGVGR